MVRGEGKTCQPGREKACSHLSVGGEYSLKNCGPPKARLHTFVVYLSCSNYSYLQRWNRNERNNERLSLKYTAIYNRVQFYKIPTRSHYSYFKNWQWGEESKLNLQVPGTPYGWFSFLRTVICRGHVTQLLYLFLHLYFRKSS